MNSALYNEEGHYTTNEWTAMCDVDRVRDGHLLTIDEYLEVEQKYVNSVIKVMELTGCKYLTISHLGDTIRSTKYSIQKTLNRKTVFITMINCCIIAIWNLLKVKGST